MPLIETESLVLKSYNLAEADRILVLLTRDHGVVRGVAKGAKRLRSKFGSSVEPFSIVRASYFQKDSVELVSIQQIELVKSYFEAAGDPAFLQKFSYLNELLVAISPPHDPNEKLYRMVKASIETAALDSANLASIGVYFELWLLQLSGYLPDWTKCHDCGRVFDDTENATMRTDFHLVCVDCRRTETGRFMTGQARSIVAQTKRLSPGDFVQFANVFDAELADLSLLLHQLISEAVGREVSGEVSLAG